MTFGFYLGKESKPVTILLPKEHFSSKGQQLALQEIINSLLGVSVAYGVSRVLPPRTGYWLADRLGGILVRIKSMGQMRALRANQWVVSGGQLSATALEHKAQQTVRSTARCLYDFYHNLYNPEGTLRLVQFEPAFEACIRRSQVGRESQLLVLPHLSNFDLVGRAAAIQGMRAAMDRGIRRRR